MAEKPTMTIALTREQQLAVKGAVEAFSVVCDWTPQEGFARAHKASVTRRGDFSMVIGFRADPRPEIWRFLLARGEAAIKAHYALWTRLYEQTGGEPGQWAMIRIDQFCADLGYRKHHKGGSGLRAPGSEQELPGEPRSRPVRGVPPSQPGARSPEPGADVLELLTTVEIAVSFTPRGKSRRTRRLRGPLWTRGLIAEQRDRYGDLFGQAREGEPALWDPEAFTFGPGPWFADAVWRRYHRHLGQIGAGLLRLRTDRDQAAIRIGGYLGSLARIDQYEPRRIRVETLLKQTGMADRYPGHPQRLQDAIETALEKLREVGVIAGWRYTDADPTEPDMDDPVALASLAEATWRPWRRRVIEIDWPEALTRETPRLQAAQRRARAESQRRRRRASRSEAEGSPNPQPSSPDARRCPPPTLAANSPNARRKSCLFSRQLL